MTEQNKLSIVLVGGLWLDGSVWGAVGAALDAAGQLHCALTLPGQGDGRSEATLADQVEAVTAAIDSTDAPVVLVGHSAAASLVWLAADRRIGRVARVVMIGGFPGPSGSQYFDALPVVDGVLAFPGWDAFEGPDSADLDAAARDRFTSAAVPVPGQVAHGIVELTDERRYAVPVTVVCPEFSPDDAREWIASGAVPELAAVDDLTLVDVDSGHWPMITKPVELAALLLDIAATVTP